MFDEEVRETLRARLTGFAQADERVVAAASLGSAARGELDRWSDIDLALRLAPGVDVDALVDAWTGRVGQVQPVVDHLDLHASGARYRVLLLASSLQVDLSFWPHDRPLVGGAPVAVLFGEFPINPPAAAGGLDRARSAFRAGWLFALHVRSALGRGRWWQTLWMLQSLRDVVVGLYCQRLGLPSAEGRGVDRLPTELLDGLARTHPIRVEPEPLAASFAVLTRLLLEEVERQGLQVSADLADVVAALARQDQGPTA